jgi:phospholipid/cholesterol/gamma-HCH transport system substrate-binding protein
MKISAETKVGLLVVVALVALGWLTVRSGSFGFGGSTGPQRTLTVNFADVNGVTAGTPVKIAGVNVGEVTSVRLLPTGSAVLQLKVDDTVPLPADVTAQITSSGLIGERFVALVPGPLGMQGQGGILPLSADTIPSSGMADVQNIGGDFAKVADDLKGMTTTLRQVLGSPENAAKLQQIIDGLAGFSNNLGGESAQTMENINRVAANFAKISDDLAAGKGLLGQLLASNGSVSGTAGMEGLGGALSGLEDLGKAAREIQAVMAKINGGEGTIGQLVNNPETAEKLNDALDTFGEVSARIEQIRTEVAFEGTSLMGESGGGDGRVELTLAPRPTRFYVVGATADGLASLSRDTDETNGPYYGKDFGKEVKFTAQFGHVMPNLVAGQDVAVRVGLKDSTGGVGVDTYGTVPYFGNRVKYSADLYDLSGTNMPDGDTPQLDVTARVDLLGNTVYGVAGYRNMLNQEYGSPMIGVGMKFQDDDLKYVAGSVL